MRRLAAWLAVVALAFSQLAAAAFACPGERPTVSHETASAPDCEGPVGAPSPLCLHHCADAPQSLDKPPTPSLPPAAAIGFAAWPASNAASRAAAPPRAPRRDLPPPEPPIALRHCVLRI